MTNLETDSRAVVRCYNKRGTAEQWIKQGKQAVKITRLGFHRFRANEVRLWLSVVAYRLLRATLAGVTFAQLAAEDRPHEQKRR